MSKQGVQTGAEIRRLFLDYFEGRGHICVNSAPLVPANDPTLLFVNAGMVQFKETFTGAQKRAYSRATSSQKCLRVSGKHNDLETVGRTARHHTFFEMLGNFSFGDYFKKEAIEFAWDFLTNVAKLPKDRLYATVYRDDDEAAKLWAEISGLPPERIQRFGEKDNFWSMGDTGPCGPCSEIHYDRGAEYACDNPECGIDCECDRFLEIWNLVFMQYDRDKDGKMTPLPNPSIDTGMGLERLVSVMQGVETNFDTDLILPIIRHMERFTDITYGASPETDVSFRVIGDHARAALFLIADDVHPGNEGRGYVLRRILRRALRHGKILGVTQPFAHTLTHTVIEIMKDFYPELVDYASIVDQVVLAEEKSFSATLEHGTRLIEEIIDDTKKKGKKEISGEDAFRLYDTFGFPLDLAGDIAEDAGLTIDMKSYVTHMEAQKVKARASWKGGSGLNKEHKKFMEKAEENNSDPTIFVGYEKTSNETKIIFTLNKDSSMGTGTTQLLLSETPFYAESGGQVSDTGIIVSDKAKGKVINVARIKDKLTLHVVEVTEGRFSSGDRVTATIDIDRRNDIRRNHSATHLLHAALRQVLGGHVKQGGSMVAPDRLRFDYTHFTAPTRDQLNDIELLVNGQIINNNAVTTEEKDIEEATASGAMALFGEKYDEKVRVVTMGDFSMELCGGTHASATGDIGLFIITSESAVAAGLRRIEGVTGWGALSYVKKRDEELAAISDALKAPVGKLTERVQKQVEKIKELEKENRKLKEKLSRGSSESDEQIIKVHQDIKFIWREFPQGEADANIMRAYIDEQKNRYKTKTIIASGTSIGDKALLTAGVTDDLSKTFPAGAIIKEMAAIVGGGGGGRPDFAQAGGKNPENLSKIPDQVPTFVIFKGD